MTCGRFQGYLLTPADDGGAGFRTGTVCTRHDALKLFFRFLEEEDDLPNPMRRVRRPGEEEVTIQPLTGPSSLRCWIPVGARTSRTDGIWRSCAS